MSLFEALRRRRRELEYEIALSRWRSFDNKWIIARDKLIEAQEAGSTDGIDFVAWTSLEIQRREVQGPRLTGNAFITFEGIQIYPIDVRHPLSGRQRLIAEWVFGPGTRLSFHRGYQTLELFVNNDPAASSLVLHGGENLFYCHIGDVTARLGIHGALQYVIAEQAKHAAAKPDRGTT